MKHLICLLVCLVVILSFYSFGFAGQEWELVHGIKELDIKEVTIKEGVVYAAGEKTIYRSEDDGNTWEAVFSVESGINFIAISEKDSFVCTQKGLFRSLDGESKWKEIFTGIGEENNILHIAFSEKGAIYLGTEKGLFISHDDGLTWKKDLKEAGDLIIKWIVFLDKDVFFTADSGVYKSAENGWKRVFIVPREDINFDIEEIEDDLEIERDSTKSVNTILANQNRLFLATDFGVFVSENKGVSWNSFTSNGLISLQVNRILFKDYLYAATDKGIFVFNNDENIWKALYKGMDTDKAQSISADENKTLWVATNKGLYKSKLIPSVIMKNDISVIARSEATKQSPQEDDIFEKFSYEPSIRDVQEIAIKYAEVHPDKISQWREAAKKKAILPDVSIGIDRNVTDLYHWEGGSTIVIDDDFLRKGKGAIEWDATMSWDLGDLIWSSDQTSIDTRSRLMVQLRDDILDETTRTYFERRRLQIKTHLSPPSNIEEKIEKELRIQELTADLDGLTGGYFSSQLEK